VTGWPWPLDGVQAWFEDLWNWISEAAAAAVAPVADWINSGVAWLNEQLSSLGTWIHVNVAKPLGDFVAWAGVELGKLYEQGARWADDVVSRLEAGSADLWARIQAGLDDLWSKASAALDGLGAALGDGLRWVGEELSATGAWLLGEVSAKLMDLLEGGLNWVQDALRGVAEALGSGLQAFTGWILESLGTIASGVAGVLGAVRSAVEGTIGAIVGGIVDLFTDVIGPGSPEAELQSRVQAFTRAYLERVQAFTKFEASSIPEMGDLAARTATIFAVDLAAMLALDIAGVAIDLAHPAKVVGARAVTQALVRNLGVPGVFEPITMVPLEASVFRPWRYRWNEAAPTEIPGPGELVAMASRRHLDMDELRQWMKLHALDEAWADRLLAEAYGIPGVAELTRMVWKGLISEGGFADALRAQGVREDFVEPYVAMIPALPGPGDLITMAVREVFTRPELQAEFPAEFGAYMALQGYAEIWARYYWAAHWVLVPVGQLYEMYHRGLISRAVLAEQLKYHDFTAEWRENLMAISWRLPGAIDARWMFRWGLLDVAGLEDLLVRDGLDPEWAPRVAQAVAKNQFMADLNRLRDNLKSDYVRGYIAEAQLRASLEALGYPATWITFHIRDALEDGERRFRDDQVDALVDGYLKDLVTDAELEERLAGVLVRPEALEMELERAYIRKYRTPKAVEPEKVPVLPVSTLLRAFREEVVDEARLREELEARGYAPEDVELMIALEEAKAAE